MDLDVFVVADEANMAEREALGTPLAAIPESDATAAVDDAEGRARRLRR